jgi:hypothetical protein
MKRPNLRIMGIEELEEVQAKGIYNILNKITTENFPNLEKFMSFRYRKPPGPNRLDQKRTAPRHIIIKITSTDNRDRLLKAERKNK